MTLHAQEAEASSDYERVGGGPAVRVVVDRFYELVLGDERLAAFFTDTDLPRLKRHQVLLVSQVMGGPAAYDGRELSTAHADMDITAEHFGIVAGHLATAMTESGVDDEIVGRVLETLAGTQDDIVSTPTR